MVFKIGGQGSYAVQTGLLHGFVRAAKQKADKLRIRRKLRRFAMQNFLRVKLAIVLLYGRLHGKMIRMIGLHHYLAGQGPAACAPCHLGNQLKSALCASIIRHIQRAVRRQHAHQRHVFKIMAFGNHLRADEHIGLLLGKRLKNF